jgi:hypothetical protein
LSRSAKFAYLEQLEQENKIKERKAYWEKIFSNKPKNVKD